MATKTRPRKRATTIEWSDPVYRDALDIAAKEDRRKPTAYARLIIEQALDPVVERMRKGK